ncbi:MAG TPA: carboxypeptidase regulatory-like domain-containing protein, partial [Bryobacteraceae bacterium]|nr:carboxypeptidase regulatory-like domain-containing protein [Bryobacteraceae bacterium]
MKRALVVSIFVLALFQYASAQVISGSISGRLVDAQGAAIAGATVTASETSRNVAVTAKSNEQGDFVFPALPTGTYSVVAEVSGFKKFQRLNIALDVNDKLALGTIVMEVGTLAESIEVSAQATSLQTESVERSATINSRQIENIEVNGRNPLDMTRLIPGVVNTATFQVAGAGGIGNIQANGNRGSANQLMINGIGNLDTGSNGSQNVTVSLDSTSEFKVLTGMYQAEYGRNAGAQISVVTKSGSEQIHGSGYFYHRHDDLNANTWYNNARGLPRALYRYNDPGYTVGGPVLIPKLIKKDKLFFFWSQ